jgi:prolipoprotein diacylglyceryltransferase
MTWYAIGYVLNIIFALIVIYNNYINSGDLTVGALFAIFFASILPFLLVGIITFHYIIDTISSADYSKFFNYTVLKGKKVSIRRRNETN